MHAILIAIAVLALLVGIVLFGVYLFEDKVGRSLSGEVAYLGDELDPVIRAVEAPASTPSAAVPVQAAVPAAGAGSPATQSVASDPATSAPAAPSA
jgi:hypothetical protein